MEFEPLSKLEMKEFDYDRMWANYDVIIILPIYPQFEAIEKQDSGFMGHKS